MDLETLEELSLTYREVGATAAGELPTGYDHQHVERQIGTGQQRFEQAADAVMHWGMQRGSGLRVQASSEVAVVDAVLVVRMGFLPAPCRVVYVIDDDLAVREALSGLFRSVGLQVRTFAAPPEFLASKPADVPSCLVLDVRLPGHSGLEFQAELAKANIHVPIIFITGHGDIPMSVKAMKAGAIEFLTKPFRDQELLDAVQAGLDRDRARRDRAAEDSELRGRFDQLTAREREAMTFVTSGLMNKQIAAEMGLSEITVKVHRGNVMRKMGAKSLAELVRMADVLGLRHTKS